MSRTVFLFGPQAVSFDEKQFAKLQSAIVDKPANAWLLDVISELPHAWQQITDYFPHLDTLSGKQLLQSLHSSLAAGRIPDRSLDLPAILLTPLTVINHLLEWSVYFSSTRQSTSARSFKDVFGRGFETLGFCTGVLSAWAVSCSSNLDELEQYGAVAIRLALLIGAAVQAQDRETEDGESASLAVAWTTNDMSLQLTQIIQDFPTAYISVRYDDRRCTVTVAQKDLTSLQLQLDTNGFKSTAVGLRGRFHSEVHRDTIPLLLKFCDSHPTFQFPDASNLAYPSRGNPTGEYVTSGSLHQKALQMILLDQSRWFEIFCTMNNATKPHSDTFMVSVGPERCIPGSLARRLEAHIIQTSDLEDTTTRSDTSVKGRHSNDIAVVGMSVKTAGANDLEEFWQLLCEGKSQHQEVPSDRVSFETVWRDQDLKRKWFGNFMDEYDAFDHRFFKKSPREVATMDPQQRLMLQLAYQAVQQSGYLSKPDPDKHIGCYVGMCATDYENNIACHAPNAFSATGNLRSFVAGKVSHYFGWTGPGLTIDTACSSSAVAVHAACKAILSGECNAALAGGTNVITNPLWFQNLAGASFLSPTGQCKPFDDKADGYCRGEAIAAVFLKKLSSAIEDGDQILGVISGTAVYQNQNCTSIFVPNSPSLSDLFRKVMKDADLQSGDVSVVEAHGTGTPVGDPVEYESIKSVLAGVNPRAKPVVFGSVKGLVGHTEGTSGLVSLIKILLMIQRRKIPPQASHHKLNHNIKTAPADNMELALSARPWNDEFRAALINNYGASGSNASLVVTQSPQLFSKSSNTPNDFQRIQSFKYPFQITGLDDRSLKAYTAKLRSLLRSGQAGDQIGSLAFSSSRQMNQALPRAIYFSCGTLRDLEESLVAFENDDKAFASIDVPPTRPVIMCFGGQVSTFVGLESEVYHGVRLLRRHLDQCDALCQSMGLDSIYPRIFQKTAINDPVHLQTALFALQYSCAMAWIDSGIQIAAVVGHSFGELTAICISGSLSLEDTLRLIASRAKIIRDTWGPESGAMLAVEGDLPDVESLLASAHKLLPKESAATIACYNSHRGFTLAGSSKAVDCVQATMSEHFPSMKAKRLNVSNAFHSTLVQPLMGALEDSAQGLRFQESTIPFERATRDSFTGLLGPTFVSEHMRNPVFFDHAVNRLVKRFPSAVWLEAGSNSTITNMASRALGDQGRTSHFQAMSITKENGMSSLADATLKLWKQGIRASFWGHHALQAGDFTPVLLPPYQFEYNKHWVAMKKPPRPVGDDPVVQAAIEEELPKGLLTFVGYFDKEKRQAKFRVNTMISRYAEMTKGHMIAHTAPICPGTLEIDLAIEALMGLRPDFGAAGLQPQLEGLENQAPICVDPARAVWLDVEALDANAQLWRWKINSTDATGKGATTLHASGKILFRSINDEQFHLDFARFERLVGYQKCHSLLNDSDAPHIIQGRIIYKTFAEIVDYGEMYRGLVKLVGSAHESAGRVIKPYVGETWLDTELSDNFCQVAGIFVNCMTDRDDSDIFIASGAEAWIRSPKIKRDDPRPETWDVYATHSRSSDKLWVSDIFIFDPRSGALLEVILGVKYHKVPKLSMSRLLKKMTPGLSAQTQSVKSVAPSIPARIDSPVFPPVSAGGVTSVEQIQNPETQIVKKLIRRSKPKAPTTQGPDITSVVRDLLSNLSGLELHEISQNADLADIGIDSLMGMEMAHEIESAFKCTLDMDRLSTVTDVQGVVACVSSALGVDSSSAITAVGNDDDESEYEEIFEEVPVSSSVGPGGLSVPTLSAPPKPRAKKVKTIDVHEYLAEMLGISTRDITESIQLFELGVDSLLSSEVRADVASKFEVIIDEDVSLEEMTVATFGSLINGQEFGKPELEIEQPQEKASVPQANGYDHGLVNGHATEQPLTNGHAHDTNGVVANDLALPKGAIIDAFAESKSLTDQFIEDYRCADYMAQVLPRQTQFCIVLCLDAFEKLGCNIRASTAGDKLPRVPHIPKLQRLVEYLYKMLETEARLIDIRGDSIVRTFVSPPSQSANALLRDLLRDFPDHAYANKLTNLTGSRMADILSGDQDGIKLIFGTEEGKHLASGLYADSLLNLLSIKQMEDFLSRLLDRLPSNSGPFKILELGAGTGGFTSGVLGMFAKAKVPVEYTFTDLAPSMVATARKRFKQYSFMRFKALDIEKEPTADLLEEFHLAVGHNCIHATHSLTRSTKNVHKMLRPDGLLLMLEMTSTIYWVDMIFGVFEGWWLFDDGRKHAIAHQSVWQDALQSVGYGHVDWTDGHHPENNIQRVIVALASGPRYDPLPGPSAKPAPLNSTPPTDNVARQARVDEYVAQYTKGFIVPPPQTIANSDLSQTIMITGATGSLGSHLVAHFARLDSVKGVVCINRKSGNADPTERQLDALTSRGIALDEHLHAKIRVLATDTAKPHLGLSDAVYAALTREVTHVLHNAWPMSGKRPLKGFEAQFRVMRNLIDFVAAVSGNRPPDFRVTFSLVSSIAVVGHYPLIMGQPKVPEERMSMASILDNGYGEAKYVCELMLDATLHSGANAHRFRSMAVRLGQVAGSRSSGYWNPVEHLAFLVKSSATLGALPALPGLVSWTPVNDVAGTLADLLLANNTPHAIYHIDNPVRQRWADTLPVLADALGLPAGKAGIVPFDEWVRRVRSFPGSAELDNPAAKLVDFLDDNFVRMSCGGLLLGTERAREHSATLRNVGPVSEEVTRLYVSAWRDMGFLPALL